MYRLARREMRNTAIGLLSARQAPDDPLFVLAPMGRSGSHLLVSYLDSLPSVAMVGEALNPNESFGIRRRMVGRRRALRHLAAVLGRLDGPVRGVKIIGHQLEQRRLRVADLNQRFPRARYIVIYRQALLEQYVSMLVARATGVWSSKGGVFDGHVQVNPSDFQVFAREHKERQLELTKDLTSHVTIAYEELRADPEGVFADVVCPFLGMRYSQISTGLNKRVDRPLHDVITNWADVAHLQAIRAQY